MMMNLTYKACRSMISRKSYESKEDMQVILDIFLLNARINGEEYNELVELLNAA